MKHTLPVTAIFFILFVIAQIFGLWLINSQTEVVTKDNEVTVQIDDTAVIGRPNLSGLDSVIYIIIGVALGTLLLLFLAKKKKVNWWKAWFMFAVLISIGIAIGALLPFASVWLVVIIAALLTVWKVYFPNVFVQNITEILMYAGIALLLAPLLSVFTAIIVLILFSLYDAYAVWKSKHMIAMAEFTSDANLFPGFSILYQRKKGNKTKFFSKFGKRKELAVPKPPSGKKIGVLGGGDVVFPLLFAGTVLIDLLSRGFSKPVAFYFVMIVVLGAALSLLFLFVIGKKDKFYPAMPFLTTGCLAGWGLMWLVIYLL